MTNTDTITINAQAFIDRYIINRRDNTRPVVFDINNEFENSLLAQFIALDTEIQTTIHNPLVRIGEQLTIETPAHNSNLRYIWLTCGYHGYLASAERDNALKRQSAIDRQISYEHRVVTTGIIDKLKPIFAKAMGAKMDWLESKDGRKALQDFAQTLLEMPESTPKTAILNAANISIEELRDIARKE